MVRAEVPLILTDAVNPSSRVEDVSATEKGGVYVR